jgi:hypothetical protein
MGTITEVYRADHVVACCVCRRDIKLGVDNPATLDQFPVYAFDGTLDYIEIAVKGGDNPPPVLTRPMCGDGHDWFLDASGRTHGRLLVVRAVVRCPGLRC